MSPSAEQTTSVFRALGSYADRIRENGGGMETKTTSNPQTTSGEETVTASSSTQPPRPPAKKAAEPSAAPTPPQATAVEDDGPWETVQSARARTKQEKEREREQDKGSNSRNWRDRPSKEKAGGSSGSGSKDNVEGQTESKTAAGSSTGNKAKRAASSAPATRAGSESGKPAAQSAATQSASTSRAPVGPPPKSAWSTPMSSQRPTGTSTPNESSTGQSSKTRDTTRSMTAPSSPSLNGTTVANSSIGDVSVPSPDLSTDTYASTTPPTSAAAKEGEDDGQAWRARTTTIKSSGDKVGQDKPGPTASAPAPAPAVPKPAPPPTINAWAARQQKAAAAAAATNPAASSVPTSAVPTAASASTSGASETKSTRLQFGDLSPTTDSQKQMPNGHAEEPVKIGGKKKKKDAASVVGGQTLVMDASQWPDVAQAGAQSAEASKHDNKKETKQTEDYPQEESSTTKKPKWTPIPASELLAAADEAAAAAEATKRQQRKRGSKQGESSISPAARTTGLPGKPRKGTEAGKRNDIRLPPNPNGQANKGMFKPTFGSLEPGAETSMEEGSDRGSLIAGLANGSASVPLSRQTSKTGQSPLQTASDLSIPIDQAMRLGAGQHKSGQPQLQNATAPLLQTPFQPTAGGAGNLPRPPRGGRNSFSGRGRGGSRGRGGFDPHFAGGAGGHHNLYAQGYGMGYNAGFYGQQPGAAGQTAMFDPMQAQWFNMQMYGRGPMPPPPTPQTVVPGLNMDPLRFYVLGQIEYYFSMQNLAMDFFLRQQMDTEGWINIPMIASFNRIKSLTPDVPMVKEMMEMSSLLEVQGDVVRLKGAEAKKWVLPDAKTSPFPPTPIDASASATSISASATPETQSASLADEASDALEALGGLPDDLDLGFGHLGAGAKYLPGGVESALMKSGSGGNTTQAASSTAASIQNGDEGSRNDLSTPGTSVVGEGVEDKAER